MSDYIIMFGIIMCSATAGFTGGAWFVIDVENSCIINTAEAKNKAGEE